MMVEPIAFVAAWARRFINRPGKPLPAPRVTTRSPAITARGFIDPRHRKGVRRIAITFDDSTFAQVSARAKAANVSFAEETRRLIERGLAP
jgi:hypothetical protein